MRRQRPRYLVIVNLVLSVVAGVSLWAAHAPHNLWPLTLVGLAVLWFVVRNASWPRACIRGFVAGGTYFFLLFDWAQVATGMLIPRILLALLEALFIAITAVIWAGLWRAATRASRWVVTAFALVASGLAWVGMEILRSSIPFTGLPWGLIAFSLVDSPLISLARFGGTELVGTAAVMVALAGALAIYRTCTLHPVRAAGMAIACASMLLAPSYIPLTTESVGAVRTAVIQGNAPELTTVDPEDWSEITTRNQVAAARSVLGENPDLIIMPESTSERDYRLNSTARSLILDLAEQADAPLLLGTQHFFERDSHTLRTNDYVVQYPEGELPAESDTYSKQRPVPFGEFVPYRAAFEKLSPKINDISVDMVGGKKPAILNVQLPERGEISFAVPICFEIADGRIVSEASASTQAIITPTSNVTFGRSNQAYQQFAIARFRAVEHVRTVVQASTMGTSGVIAPTGDVIYQSELFTSDARVADIALYDVVTIAAQTHAYRMWGTLIALVCSALYSFRGLAGTRRPHNRRKKN